MIRRGDIYYADLSPVVGSEQGGKRPVLIIQNDTGKPAFSDGDSGCDNEQNGQKPPSHTY